MKKAVVGFGAFGLLVLVLAGLSEPSQADPVPSATSQVFLPIILKAEPTPTFTPAPTATPIPPCDQAIQALQNSDFTAGFDRWAILSGAPSLEPFFNYQLLVLGRVNGAIDIVGQPVKVPSWVEWGYFSFFYYLTSAESPYEQPVDFFSAAVVDENNALIASYSGSNATAPRQEFVRVGALMPNMTVYQGAVISVLFGASNDWSYPSKWYVARPSLILGCGGAAVAQHAP